MLNKDIKKQKAFQVVCYVAELVREAWTIKNVVRNKFLATVDKRYARQLLVLTIYLSFKADGNPPKK